MNNYKKYLKYKYKYYALKKQIGGSEVTITSLTVYDPPLAIKTAYDTYRNITTNEFMTDCANQLLDVCYALTENKISQCVDKLKEGMQSFITKGKVLKIFSNASACTPGPQSATAIQTSPARFSALITMAPA
jgi:hypothetical protein